MFANRSLIFSQSFIACISVCYKFHNHLVDGHDWEEGRNHSLKEEGQSWSGPVIGIVQLSRHLQQILDENSVGPFTTTCVTRWLTPRTLTNYELANKVKTRRNDKEARRLLISEFRVFLSEIHPTNKLFSFSGLELLANLNLYLFSRQWHDRLTHFVRMTLISMANVLFRRLNTYY